MVVYLGFEILVSPFQLCLT